MLLIIIFVIALQFILNRAHSKRISALEESIKELKGPLPQAEQPSSLPPSLEPPSKPKRKQNQVSLTDESHNQNAIAEEKRKTDETLIIFQSPKLAPGKPKKAESPIPPVKQSIKKSAPLNKTLSPFVALIRDNWMGVIGALAIVIGGVFFSLTAEIMQNPFARIGSLLIFSLILIGISFKLKKNNKWILFSSWLTSIAGAIILFVSFGAGGIEGLLCIHHPIKALAFLCLGINVNLFLALRSPSQFIASFHVLLSLITLCMGPQTQQLILIGAIVSVAGLVACFRHKWELHLSLIILMFSIQHTLCYLAIGSVSPYLPIISSLLVGCSAAMVHYKKAYQHPNFDLVPFLIHLLNWGLLGWNLFLYAKFSHWTPIVLGGVTIAGFILARTAKRKEIIWLFHTDTILAQLIAIAALISLTRFPIKPIDIALLISLEIILFNSICNLQKEKILVRYGYFLQWIINFAVIILLIKDLQHDSFFYLRLGAITLMNWGYYFVASLKHFMKDTFVCLRSNYNSSCSNVSSGEQKVEHTSNLKSPLFEFVISPILLTGAISLCIGAFYSAHSILIPVLITLFVLGLAFWKKMNHHPALDFTLFFSLIFLHLIYWNALMTSSSPLLGNLIWIGILDAVLIFGMLLHSQSLKNLLYCIAIYGSTIHWILIAYYFTKDINPLIPAILYLGYSLIALELSKLNYLKTISHFFYQVGFACIICSLANFTLIHLQVQFVWKGIFIRWIIEALALSTIGYWFFFPTKNFSSLKISAKLHQSLVEIFIGFLTLCIFAECSDHWRALSWALLAFTFFEISKKPSFPKRLYLYSWGYFLGSIVHTGFLTHYQTLSNPFILKAHLPAFISIIVQTAYTIVSFKQKGRAKVAGNLYRVIFQSPSLSTLLPIFISVALILFFNFEKALLTLSWVGLICLYTIISLVVKSKRAMQISLGALAICSLRLIIFDLTQQSLSTRALVFLGVGCIMLIISVLYNKFKYRLELGENI